MVRNWHTLADGLMDTRSAKKALKSMKMISLEMYTATNGVGWEAIIEYKGSQFKLTHQGGYWGLNGSDKEDLIELLNAAKSLTKKDRGLDLIIQYMDAGDDGMTHMEDILRDFP